MELGEIYLQLLDGKGDHLTPSKWLKAADVALVAWSLLCVKVSWQKYGGVWPYVISYTGWSWVLLTARAADGREVP